MSEEITDNAVAVESQEPDGKQENAELPFSVEELRGLKGGKGRSLPPREEAKGEPPKGAETRVDGGAGEPDGGEPELEGVEEKKAEIKAKETPQEIKALRLAEALRREQMIDRKSREFATQKEQMVNDRAELQKIAQDLQQRHQALEAREATFKSATKDPIRFLAKNGINPDDFLQAMAKYDPRQVEIESKPDPRDTLLEQLATEVKRLSTEGPAWLKEERDRMEQARVAARETEAADALLTAGNDTDTYPHIARMIARVQRPMDDYDDRTPKQRAYDFIKSNVRAIATTLESKGIPLDDSKILATLNRRCQSYLDDITGGPDLTKRSDSPDLKKSPGRTISSAMASRPNTSKLSRKEREKLFDDGVIKIGDR